MSAHGRQLVDIPDDEGVHVKIAGAKSEKYVYKHVKYFRNSEGKARNRSKAIGKYDEATGKMAPNSFYFELYGTDPSMPDISVWDYGFSYLALKVSRDSGLWGCLAHAFGARTMDIVVMASYMIREGGAMDGIDDWLQRNYFPGYARLLTSQSTSKIFASLEIAQINRFFVRWVDTAMGTGNVCYDVTSISSYAQEMPSVEHGYNRDHEDLAQFNLGMFCDEVSKTPLYYNRYNGSLTDKANLSHVLSNAKDVGIKQVKMIVDGGFWWKECFGSLSEVCDVFTVGMPAYLTESQQIMESYGYDIKSYANELSDPQTYCVSADLKIGDVSGRALLYFDSLNHVKLCVELSEKINRLKAELANLKRYPNGKLKRYAPYFTLAKHENDAGFDYSVDVGKVDELKKSKGFFLIFTTDANATPDDILCHYRAKDAIEKIFSQIKCDMEGNRIRTHNEQTTDGKTFVTFIACIIRAYMLNKLNRYLTDSSTSMKKVFGQLSNITIISNADGFRFTKALTKKQKQILQPFSADKAILDSLK
jgi:transposase